MSVNELFVNKLSKLSNVASANIFSLRIIEFLTVYVFIVKNFVLDRVLGIECVFNIELLIIS
ncbi:MAG: hypothetical protein ACP5I7_07495, partial [Sulfolobales archaeon]